MTNQEAIDDLPWHEIGFYADRYSLDRMHIAACILTESLGNQYAARYEPNWRYLYFPRSYATDLGLSVETETTLQMTSYGLMQIMGSVARELGFKGHLPLLYEVSPNLDFGCMKLKKLMQKHGNIRDAISAFNQGTPRKTDGGFYENQRHVDRFDAWLRLLQA